MKLIPISTVLMAAGLLIAGPVLAQTAPTTPPKQATDGEGPTTVGPASGAYKQKTQSLAHTASVTKQKTDGEGPTTVGPASGAYKQKTDGEGPTLVGPASGAYKQ